MSYKFDVMISYNWNSGKGHADQLETMLNNAGYTVWRDVNEVSGKLTDSMAKGIANSELVLLLTSKGYEDSHNCQLEYEYVNKLRKKFIQVKVEKFDPNPEKGLSLILGDSLYYSLYDSKTYHENVRNLMAEIRKQVDKKTKLSPTSGDDEVKKSIKEEEEIVPRTDKLLIKERDFYMRLVNAKFVGKNKEGKEFAEELLADKYDEDKINDIFCEDPKKYENPVLESLCILINDLGYDYDMLVTAVNEALSAAGQEGYIVEKEDVRNELAKIDLGYKHVDFNINRNRKNIYKTIAKQAPDIARFLGLFLLDHNEFISLERKNVNNQEELVKSILDKWDTKTRSPERSWASVRQILHILSKLRVIKQIEEKFSA